MNRITAATLIAIVFLLAAAVPVLAHDGCLTIGPVPGGIILWCPEQPVETPTPTPEPPTATPAPEQPTATPEPPVPTATPRPANMIPLPIGNSDAMRYWHGPGAHDGLNFHEHGDQPPMWVLEWSAANLGSTEMFGWQPVATDHENHMKHQGYKGALGRISGVDIYIMSHNQSNPLDWPVMFHSLRMWVRDSAGGVSYFQGRHWFGWPDVRSHRLGRAEETPGFLGPNWPGRGQFILACSEPGDPPFEQWYSFAGDRGPSVSITISPAAVKCDPDNIVPMMEAQDMSKWALTGGQGTTRRYEVSWYMPGTVDVPTPRYDGWWCYQVTPDMPAQHTHFNKPYWNHYAPAEGPNRCDRPGYAAQYTAPTMPRDGIYYRKGNTFERSFPAAGITQPN